MSLKIWLPLDGDLHNQGCSNIQATISNGVIDNNGKIGKCYFLGSTSKIYSDLFTPTSNNFSLCCWYKANEENTTNGYIFGLSKQSEPSFMLYKYGINHFRLYINSYSSYAHNLDLTQWHHLTITYNGTEYKLYIDGEYKTQRERTIDYTLNEYRCFLNCRSNNSNTNGAGDIYAGENYYNDFRYYDHCLSAAEVREIAMGLILHYKLNQNFNILNNSYNYPTFNTSTASGGWFHWGRSGHVGTYGQNTDKNYIYNKNNTYSHWVANADTATGEYLVYQSPAFEGGNRSLQCIVKEENGKIIDETIVFPSWNGRNGGTPLNEWTSILPLGNGFYLCKVEGISQNGENDLIGFYVCPGYKVYFSEAYVENDRELCSEIIFNDNNIVKDSSGYGHNGEIINTLNTFSDTPRYEASTYFSNSAHIKTLNFNFPSNIWTVSCWYYRDTNPSAYETIFCLSKGNGSDANKRIAAIPNSGRVWFKGESGSLSISKLNISTWTMLTMTCDGTTVKIYENNSLIGSFSAGSQMTECTDLIIGARANSANATSIAVPYTGSISDFRIYCTPLLDTDIKLLYNIGSRIDNLGGVHSFELEETPQNKITKTGILKNNIIESYLTLPDNSYWKLILYHYVDNGNNLFTSSNATDCNDFGLYSKLKYIDNYTYNGKYEFYVIQDGKEFRWTQTSQPTASSIAGLTVVDGYTDPVTGLAKASQSNTYIGYGNWWGACGCWTKYSAGGKTGIPGFGPKGAEGICEKYLALYVRIEKNNISFTDGFVEATEFIEI